MTLKKKLSSVRLSFFYFLQDNGWPVEAQLGLDLVKVETVIGPPSGASKSIWIESAESHEKTGSLVKFFQFNQDSIIHCLSFREKAEDIVQLLLKADIVSCCLFADLVSFV